jgi:glycosyltransferase involved in cell wall biosynthesis
MRTLILSCAYPPEPVVSAQMGRDLALSLAAQGHTVKVVCPSPSRPIGTSYVELKAFTTPLVRMEDGVEVVRVPSFTSPESRLLSRMWESVSFGMHVCRYMKSLQDAPDVVYVNAWPLFAQSVITRFCARRSIPLVLQVMDVYPESLVRKLPPALRWIVERPLLWLDRRIARRANHVVVISGSMLREYAQTRNLPEDKISLIHTWCNSEPYMNMPAREVCHDRYKMDPAKFSFVFLGNIGPVAGVQLLIHAFHSANLPNSQLLIAGDGSAKADCIGLKERLGATGIHFISDPDVHHSPDLLGMANVCLLPMQKGSGSSSIPSKLMAYMLSGRPVIAAVGLESDTGQCIREADSGWVGAAEDMQWLGDKMREVEAMDQVKLVAMGEKGRAYAMRHFSKARGVQRLSSEIERQSRSGSRVSLP